MNRLGLRGLALQAIAAGVLLFGAPGLVGVATYHLDGRPTQTMVVLLLCTNFAAVAAALVTQWTVVRPAVLTGLVPCGLVLLAPHGELSGKLGVCLVLLLGFTYLWRDWERPAARVIGVLQILMVLFAAHPPLLKRGPYEYYLMVERVVDASGPLAPWLEAMLDGRPGEVLHYGWIGSVLLAVVSPSLLQLDVLVDALRRARDRIRAEEGERAGEGSG